MEHLVPRSGRWSAWACVGLSAALLAACAAPQKPAQRAPVVDRSPAGVLPPGAENAGKPGYYTVRPGDTLMRIGLETGQAWRDLQAWNGLTNPNVIEVGQVLRVVPPVVAAAPATAAAPAVANGPATAAVAGSSVQGRPLDAAASPAPTAAPAPAPAPAASEDVAFIWPAKGQLIDTFDEARYKGVGIGGRLGDPVLAAADGRVVYAGAGLRGYGNLIILKHNNTYLTAYAHNQALLVKEDQTVRQGQKIAEMGSSDADRVKLHFEVRRQGKPVDPLKHLPAR
ncbi:peptidoglycan DD-metalloendopeptidase family protein [Aquabacterium sp. A08]|uniref:peptidoglycan DD-metalloendopeptidase family protein n=1 Tax=Aquabacterium sp. A08 TaxID=2718532 RepID=UPI0014248B1A|nr:peptidoglycan DD-metalloendopeptidase family protein [Aquabacterium sp. A08]NIC40718.1 peptidoglycan DD-metalloendopeptidase family protein [Aquabacterium sp. A08]